MDIELGIIEGFYGGPWKWQERLDTVRYLGGRGYRFYLYAPKADPYLRRRWQEPQPDDCATRLHQLAAHCRDCGVRFGMGLSPYEIYRSFDADAKRALEGKLRELDAYGIQDLALLFDDMHGDVPELAERQAEIVNWALERTSAGRLIFCPTYYTDDPVLDRIFGARPDGYVERIGELLDPRVEIFWTGEEVVSREISVAHVKRVTAQLRRRPFLWDNYPVNDGQRLSQYLHVRGFTGRRRELAGHVSAHGINPALQPTLSRVPALTLIDAYEHGDDYAYADSFRRAALDVLGPELGRMLREDLLYLQDVGLDRLGEKEAELRERYGAIDHAGAREVIAWLDGEYRITDEIVRTQ